MEKTKKRRIDKGKKYKRREEMRHGEEEEKIRYESGRKTSE